MRFFDEPVTLLVARPSLNGDGVQDLLGEYGIPEEGGYRYGWRREEEDSDGDALPELMGRLCYGSFGAAQGRVGAKAYIGNIIDHGHGSVLEHACWSFVTCRGSRALMDQVTRHRAGWAFSVESTHFTRYGEGGADPGVCLTGIPADARPEAILAFGRAIEAYNVAYEIAKAQGKRKKAACAAVRGLLPLALESRFGFTANARALRHFCELRGAEDNVPEIRIMAAQVRNIMLAEAPAIFGDTQVTEGEDGFPVVTSDHRKV